MDNLISRQAAIDALKVCVTIGRGNGKSVAFKITNDYADIVRKRIEALPSAQPEVKVLRVPYAEKPIDMFDALSEEEKWQNKWYAEGFSDAFKELSAQPEYYDYSDIDDVWEFYAEEQDINLTDGAKQLKDAMWVGYRKGKQDAQQWIPCSERLPERYGWYLCTLKDGRVNCYYWNKKDEWVDNGKKHFFDLYNIRSRYTGEEINSEQEGSVYWTDWVIAWMPLPEPYKERRTDGHERKN